MWPPDRVGDEHVEGFPAVEHRIHGAVDGRRDTEIKRDGERLAADRLYFRRDAIGGFTVRGVAERHFGALAPERDGRGPADAQSRRSPVPPDRRGHIHQALRGAAAVGVASARSRKSSTGVNLTPNPSTTESASAANPSC